MKTGRLIVADTSWVQYGVASEISALVAEKAFSYLKAPVIRIGLPDSPAPSTKVLEEVFYPSANSLQKSITRALGIPDITTALASEIDNFKGPY